MSKSLKHSNLKKASKSVNSNSPCDKNTFRIRVKRRNSKKDLNTHFTSIKQSDQLKEGIYNRSKNNQEEDVFSFGQDKEDSHMTFSDMIEEEIKRKKMIETILEEESNKEDSTESILT